MYHPTKRVCISINLIASLLLCSITVVAQGGATPTDDWSALKAVSAGAKLVVKLKSGKTVEGNLNNVSDTELSIMAKNAPVALKRDEIRSVYETKKKSATKATLIGMGVGAGGGAVVGAAGGANDDSFDKLDHAVTAGLAVLGAGVGALTGYLIGRGGSKRVLIYQAK